MMCVAWDVLGCAEMNNLPLNIHRSMVVKNFIRATVEQGKKGTLFRNPFKLLSKKINKYPITQKEYLLHFSTTAT